MSSFNNIPVKPDPVPDEVYAKAKKLIVPVLKYMGASTQAAEKKADYKLNKVRHSSFRDLVVDGVAVKARSVSVDVSGAADDAQQKVNIVNINGRKYRCSNIVSVDVLVTETDAILVKNSFNSYEEVDGDDEFFGDNVYQKISMLDVSRTIKPFSF